MPQIIGKLLAVKELKQKPEWHSPLSGLEVEGFTNGLLTTFKGAQYKPLIGQVVKLNYKVETKGQYTQYQIIDSQKAKQENQIMDKLEEISHKLDTLLGLKTGNAIKQEIHPSKEFVSPPATEAHSTTPYEPEETTDDINAQFQEAGKY